MLALGLGFYLAICPTRAADALHGKDVFVICSACHGDHPGDLGPSLIGVVGRKAGTRTDYRYSGPMARAEFIWDEKHLRDFLSNPRDMIKGTKMPFDGLSNPTDIEDIIAYLASRP